MSEGICCEGCYQLGMKKGRLDVLKDELEFLRGLGFLSSDNRYCEECHFICHIINKKIQEITNEIKQIEGEK
jgi:hypothetical protein